MTNELVQVALLVGGFFLLGWLVGYIWYDNQIKKAFGIFDEKMDEACDKVSEYYEIQLTILREQIKALEAAPPVDLKGFRDWLKRQVNPETGAKYTGETVRKYVERVLYAYNKKEPTSSEKTALNRYKQFVKEKNK